MHTHDTDTIIRMADRWGYVAPSHTDILTGDVSHQSELLRMCEARGYCWPRLTDTGMARKQELERLDYRDSYSASQVAAVLVGSLGFAALLQTMFRMLWG